MNIFKKIAAAALFAAFAAPAAFAADAAPTYDAPAVQQQVETPAAAPQAVVPFAADASISCGNGNNLSVVWVRNGSGKCNIDLFQVELYAASFMPQGAMCWAAGVKGKKLIAVPVQRSGNKLLARPWGKPDNVSDAMKRLEVKGCQKWLPAGYVVQ